MKKHIMKGHGKEYVNVNPDHSLINNEYRMVRISTYCGKFFPTLEEATAGNVYRSVLPDDAEVCKTCRRLQRNARSWAEHRRNQQLGNMHRARYSS